MSLGQEIQPHLPFLRRYARALTGKQEHGDAFVRATLEAIVAAPDSFPRNIDVRLGLYRTFHEIWAASEWEEADPSSLRDNGLTGTALKRLSRVTPLSRQALLLTAMEGFNNEDAGYLIDATESEVEALIAEALEEIERQTRADVLIIEDEPIIAMEIETIVRDLGHSVSAVASTRDEAVAAAISIRPSLILADIQLADDSSGIDAVNDIRSGGHIPVVFITAFPERLLTSGERSDSFGLITKPFQRSTVKAAIAQALFLNATDGLDTKVSTEPIKESIIPQDLVQARISPVNAVVVEGRLLLSDERAADSQTSQALIDLVRVEHLTTSDRLSKELIGSNVGPGFTARLNSTRELLRDRLTEERGVLLGIHVRGLEGMLGAIQERLDDVTAADVSVFVLDLADFLRQFPSYRIFLEESRDFQEVDDEGKRALIELADDLENRPDELIEPRLKFAIEGVKVLAQEQPDPTSHFGLVRVLGNIFRSAGRWINQRLVTLSKKSIEKFDETAGTIVGKGLAVMLATGTALALLTLLAQLFPSEFAFALPLIEAAKTLLRG